MAKDLHIVSFLHKIPRYRDNTHLKEYGKNSDNWQYDEQVHITRGLKNKDLDYATVILNVKQKKIVKHGPNREATYDELYNYFAINYPQYITVIDKALADDAAKLAEADNTKKLVVS